MRIIRVWSIPPIGLLPLFLILFLAAAAVAQTPRTFQLEKQAASSALSVDRIVSNSAVELLIKSDSIWIGGGKGLQLSSNDGTMWEYFGADDVFVADSLDSDPISALDSKGAIMWAALAGSHWGGEQYFSKGMGLAVSTTAGATWRTISQPREADGATTYNIQYGSNTIKALAVTTNISNITYDLAVTSNTVWIASFAGGLRKSTDLGASWQPVVLPPDASDSIKPSDQLNFDLSPTNNTALGIRGNLNHRAFSVMAVDDLNIWAGTAGGINISTDGGVSWRKCTAKNQRNAISGNFVVALDRNVINGTEYIWASTINAEDPTEFRAVSYTTDHGLNWTTTLRGEFINSFGFQDSIVYAAAQNGLFRSNDGGISWQHFTTFVDPVSRQQITNTECYAVGIKGNMVWFTTADGTVVTEDSPTKFFGTDWKILRAAQAVASPTEAYAYPNPFSPAAEVCRVHYKTDATGKVTIKIFDFAMLPVRALLQGATRPPNQEQDEIWNGLKDNGDRTANGVYYIQVKVGDAEAVWTKIIVMQ